jgi:hypothetical protein
MPPDGKAAVRGVFTPAEGLFRLMTSAGVLGVSELDKNIRPRIDALFVADIPARTASHRILASFQDWIAACHQYRHEPGTEEPAQPPLSLAIMLVSQGAGFIRWLIQIDRTTET